MDNPQYFPDTVAQKTADETEAELNKTNQEQHVNFDLILVFRCT